MAWFSNQHPAITMAQELAYQAINTLCSPGSHIISCADHKINISLKYYPGSRQGSTCTCMTLLKGLGYKQVNTCLLSNTGYNLRSKHIDIGPYILYYFRSQTLTYICQIVMVCKANS